MSDESATEKPLYLQGRDAVVARAEGVTWRKGAPPDYHLSNVTIPQERTCQHAAGSLEAAVEDLVKVFEMEVSHKQDPAHWLSTVTERFRTRVNGGAWASAKDIAEKGSYNLMIGESVFYDAQGESFDSSHDVFHEAFPGGFFWEVLEVYSPPPVVTFKWRHWGAFTGPYKGFAPTGKRIEMFGVSVARVADDLRILEVEHFFDNSQFLGQLTGGCPIHKAGTAHP